MFEITARDGNATPLLLLWKKLIACISLLVLTSCNDLPPQPDSDQVKENTSLEPIPICKPGDERTRIPVWEPSIDTEGNLSSDPPQRDGLIVFIQLYQDVSSTECNDTALNSFSKPENPENVMNGGLAVNLRGNTQFANGICYFRGYYMNEPVMGMHQGWIETYFGSVSKEKIVLSDKFCLEKDIE